MRMLLTSGGVTNPSIRAALVDLLGRPVEECSALAVPTAQHGHPLCSPESAYRFVAGASPAPMTDLGWRSVGLLELLALPTMPRERWEPWVRAADVLLVDGGDATYLAHHLRASGLADLLPELHDTVWVGVSAGSMVMTPRIGPKFVEWAQAADDRTLGVVDFSIFPHLEHPGWESNTLAAAESWADGIDGPAFALDDQSAVVVDGARVEVVSEGLWRQVSGGSDDANAPSSPLSGRRREEVVADLLDALQLVRPGERALVAIDGFDGVGKSHLAAELAALAGPGHRPVVTLSIDGFHHPRAERRAAGLGAEGFYRGSYRYDEFRRCVVDRVRAGAPIVPAVFDVDRDEPVGPAPVELPGGALVVVDGIFLQRPELSDVWDATVWVDAPFEVTVPRGNARWPGEHDPDPEAPAHARYVGGQRLYLAEASPRERATWVFDNTDLAHPGLRRGDLTG